MQREARLIRPLARRFSEYDKLAQAASANTYRMERALADFQRLLSGFSDTADRRQMLDWCAEQQHRIHGLKEEFRFNFGAELRSALAGQGFLLVGQFPTLRAGLYTLRLDFDAGSAGIYWGPEVETIRTRVPLASEAITRAVADFDRNLRSPEFHPEGLLALVYQGYQRECLAQHIPDAGRVLLTAVLREVAFLVQTKRFGINPVRGNFRDYSRIQFGFDLFRLKQFECLRAKGRQMHMAVATFDSTTDRAKALWVPDNEQGEGTYYSYLSFAAEGA